MAIWGAVVGLILYFGGQLIFQAFLPNEPHVVAIGANCLRILAYCQVLSCLESAAQGAFNGMGKTVPPAISSVGANAIRLCTAYVLSRGVMGLDGIWWSISMGAALRGAWMYGWYLLERRKLPKQDALRPCENLPECDTI